MQRAPRLAVLVVALAACGGVDDGRVGRRPRPAARHERRRAGRRSRARRVDGVPSAMAKLRTWGWAALALLNFAGTCGSHGGDLDASTDTGTPTGCPAID